MREERLRKQIDWLTIGLFVSLVLMGWLSIYAADYEPGESGHIFQLSQNSGKQFLWIISSGVLILGIILIDYQIFQKGSWIFYGLALFSLILVLLLGDEVAGSKSWIKLGEAKFQPSELAKFATLLALANFLDTSPQNLKKPKHLMLTAAIFLVPAGLVVLQGDAGTALVFTSLFLVLFREGMSPWILIIPASLLVIVLLTLSPFVTKLALIIGVIFIALLVVGLFIRSTRYILLAVLTTAVVIGTILSVDFMLNDVLQPHQKRRVLLLVNPDIDPLGVGWNVTQSKIAIGSGGLFGQGFLQGTQTQNNFVPEQSTDFIFCTVGEEYGWVGSTMVLLLYGFLLFRILAIADRQKSSFSRVFGYGVASIFFFHITVNVSMTVGLFPVMGIPLPFLSYGGSNLWSFSILLFTLLKLDAQRMQVLQRG